MNRTARIALATGLIGLAALGASAANAQVYGSVSINVPGPVAVVPPPPVFVAPAPVFVPRPVAVAPRPVYGPPPAYYYQDRGHYHREYNARRHDRDGDGVPNRYDRRPKDPYRY